MEIRIEPLQEEDQEFISDMVRDIWGEDMIVVHGETFYIQKLEGIKAVIEGQIAGFLHYQYAKEEFEILTLASHMEGYGVGSALVEAAEKLAHHKGCHLLSVVSTNNNLHALSFYQKRGFHLAALFPGKVDQSREIKPTIPKFGDNNIPIRDEIRLEKNLSRV